jgi:hypothetical protein
MNKQKHITTAALCVASSLLASCSSTNSGWGHNQGRGTLGGAVLGATAGGIIGHQSGKQKEGILIGTLLGGITGNQIGRGKDQQLAQRRADANVDQEMQIERARVAQLERELTRARELKNLRDRQQRAQTELNGLR